jgi:hypothetical protein
MLSLIQSYTDSSNHHKANELGTEKKTIKQLYNQQQPQ